LSASANWYGLASGGYFANASGTPQILWQEAADFGGTITVWTAFTEANEDTACLQFIPGTHQTMFYDEAKRMHYDPSRINQEEKEGIRRGFFGYDYRQLQIDPHWKPDDRKPYPWSCVPDNSSCFGRR
jgi:non-haem Fe2+, alpha-ketoglutarate-dependent halogenase